MFRPTFLIAVAAAAVVTVLPRRPVARTEFVLAEEIRIGDSDDSVQLTRIGRVAAAADGSIYIAQPLDCQVLVLDEHGMVRERIGRCGGGPGEFRDLSNLGFLGDTIWVWDQQSARVSYFLPGAQAPTRTVRLDLSRALVPGLSLPHVQAVFADGSMHLYASAASRYRPALAAGPRDRVVHINASGIGQDTLWMSAEGRQIVLDLENGRGGRLYMRPLFPDSPELRVASTGASRVVVDRRAPDSGTRSTFRVTTFDAALDTAATVAVPFTPVHLDRGVADSVRDARLARMNRRAQSSMPTRLREAISNALTASAFYPPVDQVALGADGIVWLRMAPITGNTARWYVLDVAQKRYRVVQAPASANIVEARGALVWSVELGPDDEPELVRYRLAERR